MFQSLDVTSSQPSSASKASTSTKPTNVVSTPVPSSPSTAISAIDRAISQRIGLRLRNLLKLPKAHKWVSYEWFYSYIDKPLLLGKILIIKYFIIFRYIDVIFIGF